MSPLDLKQLYCIFALCLLWVLADSVNLTEDKGSNNSDNNRVPVLFKNQERMDQECMDGFRACNDTGGTCAREEFFCDNVRGDCPNNSDESSSICRICSSDEFQCFNKECVATTQRCNGFVNCADKTDEIGCIKIENGSNIVEIEVGGSFKPLCFDGTTAAHVTEVCRRIGKGDSLNTTSSTTERASVLITGAADLTLNDFLVTSNQDLSSNCAQGVLAVVCGPPAETCGIQVEPVLELRPPIFLPIVGGIDSMERRWPWQAVLLKNNNFNCGGTILSRSWILTAFHCIGRRTRAADLSVTVGQASSPEMRSVMEIIVHPEADTATGGSVINDFALLKLASPLPYTDYIRPSCLPQQGETLPTDSICFITGYGLTEQGGELAAVLQEARIVPVSINNCTNQLPQFGSSITASNHICAGFDAGGVDTCQGDSGGPLVCLNIDRAWEVRGVTSFGIGCAIPSTPGVYANVANARSWIDSYVNPPGGVTPSPGVCSPPKRMLYTFLRIMRLGGVFINCNAGRFNACC